MNFFHWFLIFLLSFLALLGLLFIIPAPPDATGMVHPDYTTMQKSGTSIAAVPLVKYLGLVLGVGILGLFAFPLFLGARKASPEKNRSIQKQLGVGMGLYATIFSILVVIYWSYQGAESTSYILGFPLPTAWMLFALATTPLFFMAFYLLRFNTLVITPEEQEQFHRLVRERQQRKEEKENIS